MVLILFPFFFSLDNVVEKFLYMLTDTNSVHVKVIIANQYFYFQIPEVKDCWSVLPPLLLVRLQLEYWCFFLYKIIVFYVTAGSFFQIY